MTAVQRVRSVTSIAVLTLSITYQPFAVRGCQPTQWLVDSEQLADLWLC